MEQFRQLFVAFMVMLGGVAIAADAKQAVIAFAQDDFAE